MSETPPKPKHGDIVERLGQMWEVVDVCPIWTPYRRRGQDTKVEGWGMALRPASGVAPRNEVPDV